jgi:hypothetical protein
MTFASRKLCGLITGLICYAIAACEPESGNLRHKSDHDDTILVAIQEVESDEDATVILGNTTVRLPAHMLDERYRVVLTRLPSDSTVKDSVLFRGGSEVVQVELFDSSSGALIPSASLKKAFEVQQTINGTLADSLSMLVSIGEEVIAPALESMFYAVEPELRSTFNADGTTTAASDFAETRLILAVMSESLLPVGISRYQLPFSDGSGTGSGSSTSGTGSASSSGSGSGDNLSLSLTAWSGTIEGQITATIDIGVVREYLGSIKLYRTLGSTAPNDCYASGAIQTWSSFTSDSLLFSDNGLTPGGFYSYLVCAFNTEGTEIARELRQGIRALKNAAWGNVVLVYTPADVGHNVTDYATAVDASGNVLVLTREATAGYFIRVRRYLSATQQWESTVELASNSNDVFRDPKIAVDDSGNAIAIWTEENTSIRYSQYISTYSWINGWSSIADLPLPPNPDGVSTPQLVMNRAGDAMVVSVATASAGFSSGRLFANYYSSTSGWGSTASVVHTSDSGVNPVLPRAAIDSQGDALVVFVEYPGGGNTRIYASAFTKLNASFATSQLYETMSSNGSADVNLNTDGDGMIVWSLDTDNTSDGGSLFALRYLKGQSWQTPVELLGEDALVTSPRVVMYDQVNTLIVYCRYMGEAFTVLYENGIWSSTERLGAEGTICNYNSIEVHSFGNSALISWDEQLSDSTTMTFAKIYRSGGTWSSHEHLSHPSTSGVPPRASAGSNGAAAVIYQGSTDGNIFMKMLEW